MKQVIGSPDVRADNRLDFIRQQAERKQRFARELFEKQRRRQMKLVARSRAPRWELKFQAGCWFWVDENTGEATLAPPPAEKQDDDSSKGATKTFHARQRSDQSAQRKLIRSARPGGTRRFASSRGSHQPSCQASAWTAAAHEVSSHGWPPTFRALPSRLQ